MYKKLLKLNLRLIFSSLIFILFFAFTLVFFILFLGYTSWSPYLKPINYSIVMGMLEYLEVGIFVMSFCVAMFFSHQKCTLEDVCFIPHTTVVSCKLGAVIIASSSICLIPSVFIIFAAFRQGTDARFTLITLAYTLLRWLVLLLISDTAGFLTGQIFKNVYSYLLAAPVAVMTCFLNTTIVDIFFGRKPALSKAIAQLLSLSDGSIGVAEMDYPGPRLDLYFLMHILFLLCCAALMFWGANFLVAKGARKRRGAIGVSLFAAVLITAEIFINLMPTEYDYLEKLYILSPQKQSFEISSYSGELSLSETARFSGSFIIEPKGKQSADHLMVRLDNCFSVDILEDHGQAIPYVRKGDYLIFNAPAERTEYTIRYHGRVQYISDIGCVNIFTSWWSSALPPNFAFIPIIDGDQSTKTYDIVVASANTVISNLDVENENQRYRVRGEGSSCCLFSGFLSSYEKDGITFYRTKYNFATDYDFVYSDAVNLGEFMDPRKFEIRPGHTDTPQKVFLIYDIYGVYGYPVVYDGYTILNYGLTS